MRRSNLAIAGLCAAAALAVFGAQAASAAPAQSTEPQFPEPVEFSQRLPELRPQTGPAAARSSSRDSDDRHAREGPVRFTSPVVEAPRRFDIVGVPRSRTTLEYRTRRRTGRWSKWTEADPAMPVYAGGADFVQVRSRHARPTGRLFYVRVRQGKRARAISSQAPAPGGLSGVVPREQWGAEESCKPRGTAAYGEVRAAVIHHTVSSNDYSEAEAPGMVLGICRFHRNGNGWNDIGYNALVDRFGRIYEGRAGGLDRPVVGAQVAGFNSQTTGIASIGTHTSAGGTPETLSALQRYLSWKLSIHGVPAQGMATLTSSGGSGNRFRSGTNASVETVTAHRVLNSTACPGTELFEQLPQIRAGVRTIAVQRGIIEAQLTKPTIVSPEPAVIRGRAVASDTRAPLAGARLRLDLLGRGGWRVFRSGATGADGTFSFTTPVAANRSFRVRVLQHQAYAGTSSPRLDLAVRPNVAARISAASRPVRGGRIRVVSTTSPAKSRAALIVYRSTRGAFRRVARLERRFRGRRGRFVFDYTPRKRGSYRFFVYVKRDRSNAAGRSDFLSSSVTAASGGSAPETPVPR